MTRRHRNPLSLDPDDVRLTRHAEFRSEVLKLDVLEMLVWNKPISVSSTSTILADYRPRRFLRKHWHNYTFVIRVK